MKARRRLSKGAATALARLVLRVRSAKGLSRSYVASRGGMSRGTLIAIERGELLTIRRDTLDRLAGGLDLPMSQIDAILSRGRGSLNPIVESAVEILLAMSDDQQRLSLSLLAVIVNHDQHDD